MDQSKKTISNILNTEKHPITKEIEKHGLALWQVRRLLGGLPAEGTLSRMFRCIQPMPADLEKKLSDALASLEGAS